MLKQRRHPLLAQALMLAAMHAMPSGLGQQQQIATRPGSGVAAKRDRPTGFWGGPYRHVPRERTPEQRSKHAAKLLRRRHRWLRGLAHNPCLAAQAQAKALAAAAGKTLEDLAYIDGFSQALEDTKALALAPDDWRPTRGR